MPQSPMRSHTALVRASVMLDLIQRVANVGFSGMLLLQRNGLHADLWRDPYATVPMQNYLQLFEEASTVLGKPDLGIELAQNLEFGQLGPLTLLVISQPTLGAALDCFITHIGSLQSGTTNRLYIDRGLAIFDYRVEQDDYWPRRQDAEFSLMTIYLLIKRLYGPQFQTIEVHLEHQRPLQSGGVDALVKCPVHYGESSNRLIFDADLLDKKLQHQQPLVDDLWARHLQQFLEQQIGKLHMEPEQGWMRVRLGRLIDAALGRETPKIELFARRLNLSVRSLQRILTQEGTSFAALLAERRYRQARHLLEANVLSIEAIAQELGYNDATAFSRAFSKWAGYPPRMHGKQARN